MLISTSNKRILETIMPANLMSTQVNLKLKLDRWCRKKRPRLGARAEIASIQLTVKGSQVLLAARRYIRSLPRWMTPVLLKMLEVGHKRL